MNTNLPYSKRSQWKSKMENVFITNNKKSEKKWNEKYSLSYASFSLHIKKKISSISFWNFYYMVYSSWKSENLCQWAQNGKSSSDCGWTELGQEMHCIYYTLLIMDGLPSITIRIKAEKCFKLCLSLEYISFHFLILLMENIELFSKSQIICCTKNKDWSWALLYICNPAFMSSAFPAHWFSDLRSLHGIHDLCFT